MNNWLEILEYNYKREVDDSGEMLKTEFVANNILGIFTYSNMTDHFLCVKTLEVMEAIHYRKTFDYITNTEDNLWYMAVLHMDFLSNKISWGTSIRGAFWESFHAGMPHNPKGSLAEIGDSMLFKVDTDEQVEYIISDNDEWDCFVIALLEFCQEDRKEVFNEYCRED